MEAARRQLNDHAGLAQLQRLCERLERAQAEHVALLAELEQFVNVDGPPDGDHADDDGPWWYLGLLHEAMGELQARLAAEMAGQEDGLPF